PEPAPEPEPEPEQAPEPAPEPEPEPEQAPEPAPEPEPEPEPPAEPEPAPELEPSLSVDPVEVTEGLTTFTITGSGFDPDLTIYVLLCPLPDMPLSVYTPTEEVEAAMASIPASACALSTASIAEVDPQGSFTVQRDVVVNRNFMWGAGDIDGTQAAGAAVFLELPFWQRPGGGWVPPTVGAVPELVPLCAEGAPERDPDCRPRPEWLRGDGSINFGKYPYDQPRESAQVAAWRGWCLGLDRTGWCEYLLSEAHQALDYLGANTECVIDAYTERLKYLLARGSGADEDYAREAFSWIRCATVIDPIVEAGHLLSETPGMTLAERCRAVLTDPHPDIELESGWFANGDPPKYRVGQDCDAWAAEKETINQSFAKCHAASSLAQQWMEHVHGQPERYYSPFC
ncbi:MAG: hypothetical protein OXC00_16810, partial [Acidimicrobiaceae bacterium]|nr:hypothetical protein [Acidimicrobiaceae bacterium]